MNNSHANTPPPVPDWFKAKLAASGITPDHAANSLKFRIVQAVEANRLLGFGDTGWPDAFAIPFFDPKTGAAMTTPDGRDFVRLRFERPVVMRDGKEAKYLSPVEGGQHAYILPEVHQHLVDNPANPVLLTEGELKAVCATQRGIPMIGLPGIDGFSGGDKRLLPELAHYATKGRKFIMVYDSDANAPEKRHKFDKAARRFAKALAKYGCKLKRVILPELRRSGKCGLDDLMVGGGWTAERIHLYMSEHATAVQAENAAPELPPVCNAAEWLLVEYPEPDQVISGVLDRGTKMAIIGASKSRKTWFALDMAVALASGRKFLHWHVPYPRRVLVVNLEIPEAHMHRRLDRVVGADRQKIGDRLAVLNVRAKADAVLHLKQEGRNITAEWTPGFLSYVKKGNYDLVIFDPFYKLQSIGDENSAQDVKPIIHALDTLAEETGAAVCYVHHMPKGHGGDRQAIDRAAGSGALARDFDACITLTRHATDGLLVMETIVRNYTPPADTSIHWDDTTGRFELDDTLPQVLTSKTSPNTDAAMDKARKVALEIVANGPVPNAEFETAMREYGIKKSMLEKTKSGLLKSGELCMSEKQGFGGKRYIGLPGNTPIPPIVPGRMDGMHDAIHSSRLPLGGGKNDNGHAARNREVASPENTMGRNPNTKPDMEI